MAELHIYVIVSDATSLILINSECVNSEVACVDVSFLIEVQFPCSTLDFAHVSRPVGCFHFSELYL
jgi:hypothetical protein